MPCPSYLPKSGRDFLPPDLTSAVLFFFPARPRKTWGHPEERSGPEIRCGQGWRTFPLIPFAKDTRSVPQGWAGVSFSVFLPTWLFPRQVPLGPPSAARQSVFCFFFSSGVSPAPDQPFTRKRNLPQISPAGQSPLFPRDDASSPISANRPWTTGIPMARTRAAARPCRWHCAGFAPCPKCGPFLFHARFSRGPEIRAVRNRPPPLARFGKPGFSSSIFGLQCFALACHSPSGSRLKPIFVVRRPEPSPPNSGKLRDG